MPVKFDFMEKIGTDFNLPLETWKTMPKSRWLPPVTPATVEPTVYLNVKYKIASTAKRPGRLWVRMMRENPDDGTLNYFLWLPVGYTTMLDQRCPGHKWWPAENAKRYVHIEVQVSGVQSAYLNDTSYVAYDQKY